ncbi:MazG nucleotide pyrophosphohydrolase domain-containing protein [Corynebacterium crudilactis]|uniref:NTP pyrophosphohydrolase MazG-like domain-containing protein n=1 Tax=Corynebacterium crudilactis TaxID=1652495 RepID=A0A172QSC5_9CORY|nr:MazG nucleotide pyrophosphohydrolase domain-containing protein [Corynebacterium crudilactis]ANE03597.1 hypothetical protein ccrud_04790 [Corynebacterium crudilactis]
MRVIFVDPKHPVLPVPFVEAVFGRGESVFVDPDFPVDIEKWGIEASTSAQWLVTANPSLTSMLIDAPLDPLLEAVGVMQAAVSRGEWEREQTHESLIPYLEEESQEFIEAIEIGNDKEMKNELGDVLLQVLFHAEIAARQGRFDIFDVAASFVAKMKSRSPYLFDGSTGIVDSEEQERLWAMGKAQEKLGR